MKATDFINREEQKQIVKAIEAAELNTSGEIRVHVESLCKANPIDKAIALFNRLNMQKTKERNGVLIYIAFKSRKFAIIGDTGINDKVPKEFWDREKEILHNALKEGHTAKGIITVIERVGKSLKDIFPYQKDDVNEQSNEISFGN